MGSRVEGELSSGWVDVAEFEVEEMDPVPSSWYKNLSNILAILTTLMR